MKMIPELNTELYKIFYTVAVCGNITEASKQLYLTQPSVSKYIQKLEQELECKLFHRTKRGVKLTVEGKSLMERIEPAFNLILAAERDIKNLHDLESGSVSIASTEFSFSRYVLPVMKRFMKLHTGVHVHFSNSLNENMLRMLRDGEIDIAILHEPFILPKYVHSTVLERMEEIMVAGTQYRHLSNRVLTPAQLLEQPFVTMPSGSSNMSYLENYFQSAGIDNFKPALILTTVELMVQAISGGLGIGILPKPVAEPLIADGKMLRLKVAQKLPRRNACIITNQNLTPSLAVKAFRDELTQWNMSPPEH